MTRSISVAALVLAVIGSTMAQADAAQATTTSGVPTTSTNSPVRKGGTVRVYVHAHGSRVLSTSTVMFRGTKRVPDMSPAPGRYTARTSIKYRIKTTRSVEVWMPYDDCADYSEPGYDENGDGDYEDLNEYPPYDACAEGEEGYYDTQKLVTYGARQRVVRNNRVRVLSDESPGCATFREYRAIRNGMTQRRVKRIVGARGHITYRFLTPNYSHISREFRVCNGDSYDSMSVEFYKYSPRGTYKAEDKGWYDF